jgi:hypothetical protein
VCNFDQIGLSVWFSKFVQVCPCILFHAGGFEMIGKKRGKIRLACAFGANDTYLFDGRLGSLGKRHIFFSKIAIKTDIQRVIQQCNQAWLL